MFSSSSQVRPLPLGLGTCLPLRLELLFHLLNSRLVFLDPLLNLCNKRLLVVELGQKSSSILLLALDGRLQLLPGSLEVAHRLLGHLQLTLYLPSLLLNLCTATLLPLQGRLELVQSGLELVLDLVEVGDLVLGDGEVLSRLGRVLTDMLLL